METTRNDFPRQLGPYRLEELLGQGGMGVVYLAYDKRLDRRVAVKRVLADGIDPKRRARLRREARTAAQLAHPAIVQVFDLIEEEDGDWIVMEFVEGVSLAERLLDGPLDVDVALEYGRQIAEGLAAAHALEIIHRDLKTENVMVLPDERVKILDFGLAKQFGPPRAEEEHTVSVTGQVLGTGRAMSPEQARGVEVGPRSDLFSFGVLLYEILTGISPFRGQTFVDTLGRVVTHQQPPVAEMVADVPGSLSELIDRLLNKAPELRPQSAQGVALELAHLIEERRYEERRSLGSGLEHQPSEHHLEAVTVGATETSTGHILLPVTASDGVELETEKAGRRRLQMTAVAAVVMVFVALRFWSTNLPRDETASVAELELLESHPADPRALYEEGMRATRRPDQPESLDRAAGIFQQLLAGDGASATAHAGLARAYWQKARNANADPVFAEQALAVAREAVRLNPYLADARVSLGLVELLKGRPDEARRELESALELDPAEADALFGLGKLAQSMGHPEEAEGYYRRAVEVRPVAMYHDALGVLLYEGGRYSEAEESFRHSLELAPDNIYSLRNLAGILHFQGRIDEAASMLQQALKIRPEASLYSNLGSIFFDRGLYTKAATAFENALRMQGANDHVFWNNLADAYRQIPGKEDAARATYRRAIQLLNGAVEAAPTDVRMLSRRALAQARAGLRIQALSDIARTRDLDPGKDVYSRYRLALAEELCGNRDHALNSLEVALRAGLDLSAVRREPDLLDLRADPRFHHLLMALEEEK